MAKKSTRGKRKAAKMMTKAGTTAGATERSIQIHRDADGPAKPALLINTAGLLSLRNHRLYRQGRVYRQRIKVGTRSTNVTLNHIEVYRLRNTWMLRKAYKMALDHYMEATATAREGHSKDQTRWLDFRVDTSPGAFATEARAQNTKFSFINGANTYTYELPINELSLVPDSGGVSKKFQLVGGSSTIGYNILEEYNRYADMPDALPSGTATGLPYGNLIQEQDDAVARRVQEDGADAPYDMENISTDIWEYVGTLHIDSQSGEQTLSTPYVDCPLGTMLLVGTSPDLPSPNDFYFTLEVAPGDYKGVAADVV